MSFLKRHSRSWWSDSDEPESYTYRHTPTPRRRRPRRYITRSYDSDEEHHRFIRFMLFMWLIRPRN